MSAMKNKGMVNSCVVTLASPNIDPSVSDSAFISHRVDKGKIVLNAGYAFNRTVWRMIKRHLHEFMYEFNRNWDCALADLMDRYPSMGDLQITAHLSRVRNIGEVGLHMDDKDDLVSYLVKL